MGRRIISTEEIIVQESGVEADSAEDAMRIAKNNIRL